jgi:hypothetical protein
VGSGGARDDEPVRWRGAPSRAGRERAPRDPAVRKGAGARDLVRTHLRPRARLRPNTAPSRALDPRPFRPIISVPTAEHPSHSPRTQAFEWGTVRSGSISASLSSPGRGSGGAGLRRLWARANEPVRSSRAQHGRQGPGSAGLRRAAPHVRVHHAVEAGAGARRAPERAACGVRRWRCDDGDAAMAMRRRRCGDGRLASPLRPRAETDCGSTRPRQGDFGSSGDERDGREAEAAGPESRGDFMLDSALRGPAWAGVGRRKLAP